MMLILAMLIYPVSGQTFAATIYLITDLGNPGGGRATASAINDAGGRQGIN